jgi:hypothetical protein
MRTQAEVESEGKIKYQRYEFQPVRMRANHITRKFNNYHNLNSTIMNITKGDEGANINIVPKGVEKKYLDLYMSIVISDEPGQHNEKAKKIQSGVEKILGTKLKPLEQN